MSDIKRYTMDVRQSDYHDHVIAVNDGVAIEAETFGGPEIQWVLAADHDAEVDRLKRQIAQLELSEYKGWLVRSAAYICVCVPTACALITIAVLR